MTLWTPANITDGSLDLWYDPAVGVTQSAGVATVWVDAANSVQMNSSGTVAYSASTLNGLPGFNLHTNANSGWSAAIAGPRGDLRNTYSVFAVVNPLTGNGSNNQIIWASQCGPDLTVAFDPSNPPLFQGLVVTVVAGKSTTSVPQSAWVIAEFFGNALTGGNTIFSGTPYKSGNAGSAYTLTSGGGIGASNAPGLGHSTDNEWLDGQMTEVIFLNVNALATNTAEQQLIEGYLAWRWGLQAQLPGGHPYAGAAPTVGGGPAANPFVNKWTLR